MNNILLLGTAPVEKSVCTAFHRLFREEEEEHIPRMKRIMELWGPPFPLEGRGPK